MCHCFQLSLLLLDQTTWPRLPLFHARSKDIYALSYFITLNCMLISSILNQLCDQEQTTNEKKTQIWLRNTQKYLTSIQNSYHTKCYNKVHYNVLIKKSRTLKLYQKERTLDSYIKYKFC